MDRLRKKTVYHAKTSQGSAYLHVSSEDVGELILTLKPFHQKAKTLFLQLRRAGLKTWGHVLTAEALHDLYTPVGVPTEGFWIGPVDWDLAQARLTYQGFLQVVAACWNPRLQRPRTNPIPPSPTPPPAWWRAQRAIEAWLYPLMPSVVDIGSWQGPSLYHPASVSITPWALEHCPMGFQQALKTALQRLPLSNAYDLHLSPHRHLDSVVAHRRPRTMPLIDDLGILLDQAFEPSGGFSAHQRLTAYQHLQKAMDQGTLLDL